MTYSPELIDLAINTARESLQHLKNINNRDYSLIQSEDLHELKSKIDIELNILIEKKLKKTNIPILSEEEYGAADVDTITKPKLWWIVDPLDGTINFVRNLGPCGISIALYSGMTPLFGVVVEYPSGDIYWGGRGVGSFVNGSKIIVSDKNDPSISVACTGKPSRLILNETITHILINLFNSFAKIRMLGSASISLIKLARGDIEFYSENEIMIWDVAAGIAIVEGAGGVVSAMPGNHPYALNVTATNGKVAIN
ncbi:inositol monophosphatase family protein [Polynucleobacter bastaniensis]|uniref:inositol monophosphatase family protein n=1 Tax=Polynucleobacter bastaniensis TaxID=2081039 RepID=UPI001C0D8B7B|nr:inositol monophosphatase [Polynucleobacter bastaniensis]MBU3598274.1 inositol monophosphatase [Polynucleobacter bastaniensis]